MDIHELNWEKILLSCPEPAAVVDAAHRFSWVNGAMESFLGIPREEIIGKACHTLLHAAEEPVADCALRRLAESGRREWAEIEFPGKNRWFKIAVDPLTDGNERLVGTIHSFSDITKLKEAEKAAVLQSERLVSLMNNLPGVVYRGHRNWTVSFIGADVRRITGYTQEEFQSGVVTWREFVHPEDLVGVKQAFREAVREKRRILRVEYRVRHKDGSIRRIADRRQMIYDEKGEFEYVDGLLLDITDRKKMEEALHNSEEQLRQSQKMEAIGRLAGGVAHDFNNLLTAIRGYSDLLLHRLGGASPMRRDVEEIQKAGERATSLTRQLLAFSRKQVMQPKVVDLNGVVAGMDRMLRRLIGEDVDLVTVLPPGLWSVMVDPGQVEQVVMNLIVNARDAMPAGGKVTIETANVELDDRYVRSHAVVLPGEYAMLVISDTGTGMNEETKNRLFEPFYTTKEKGKGTGLGLSTVYGIVKQSGGYIWVYSEIGEGTAFKVYFPRFGGVAGESKKEGTSSIPPNGRETVLLVEDEEAVRKLVRAILEGNGYEVLSASNGEEAISIGRSHKAPVHLILTDVVMPRMGGREAAETLASHHPGAKVLYMSGYTNETIVNRGVLDPGIPFLEKPFTPDALLRKVRHVLDLPAAG